MLSLNSVISQFDMHLLVICKLLLKSALQSGYLLAANIMLMHDQLLNLLMN